MAVGIAVLMDARQMPQRVWVIRRACREERNAPHVKLACTNYKIEETAVMCASD
jgi:hypothetical protein